MNICIVTCYKFPDYVRAVTLRSVLHDNRNNKVEVIKNTHAGILRYPEVAMKLVLCRIRHNHDTYLLTFRGYEMLPLFLLVTIGKRRVFDELINLIEWVVYEHKKIGQSSLAARLLYHSYRFLLSKIDAVLADTKAHAMYSAELMKLPPSKFWAVPVSTDEEVFHLRNHAQKSGGFQVFYYGNMLPLHGLMYVIEAALKLKDVPGLSFLLVGGKETVQEQIEQATRQGAHITYKSWIPYQELPAAASAASLCLAGPFGGTLQASMVVTGKTYQFLSLGMPTLIGQTKEAPELVDKANCLIVPQADAEALANKILWAYKHAGKLLAIGSAGRAAYERYYSNKVIAAQLEEILRFEYSGV